MIVDLPWPHKDLSPNARVHHMKRHRMAKRAREAANWIACGCYIPPEAKEVLVTITASPPTRRAFDDDNFIARCKPYLDGIADAAEINDSRFRIQALRRGEIVKGGNVRFEIEVPA